jgi:ubiquinone/menaquinone biosynthesis C-methylase UbiE
VQPGEGEVANVSGNHFDKHGSENAVIRRLMDRFHVDLIAEVSSFSPTTVLDAGCGEGRTSEVIRSSGPRVTGLELEADALSKAPRAVDGLGFVAGSVYDLPFPDRSFDVVTCTEVLEHLTDPAGALSELVRVARSGVVVTVPREPWWRMANMARGAYLSRLGNTPGHVQHFTKRRLQTLLSRQAGDARVEVGASTMWRVGRLTL